MVLDSAVLQAALQSSTSAVFEYAGSTPIRQVIEMLNALAALYAIDLVYVTPEELAAKQASIKQVVALIDVLSGVEHASPRI